jgi:hypothetical protein
LIDLYAVTYRLKEPKRDGTTSLIGLMTCIVVAQKLRGLDALNTDDSTKKQLIGCQ